MALFDYSGRNQNGELVTGSLEAANPNAAAIQLQNQSIIPVSIKEQQRKESAGLNLDFNFRKKINYDDLIMLCRQMRALTRAGVPIIQAVSGLSEISKSETLKESLADIGVRLASGTGLGTAMAAHPKVFNSMFVSMVQVGENTGRLEDAFSKLISHIEMERDTRNRMTQAMRYPTFVVGAMFVAMMIINMFVIPQFAKVFSKVGADLPTPTLILVSVSNFTVEYWWLVFGTLFAVVFGFRYYIKTPKGHLWWDEKKLRLPVIGGIFERIALSRFSRSFAMTFESGVPVLQALSIVGPTVGNEYIAHHIAEIRRGVERGDSLARTAAAAGIFSDLVLQMIAIGEETGSLDKLLHDVADFYDEEVDYDLKGLADAIEPIVLVFLGVLVLVLALGVFLPMWELGSAMKR